MVFAFKEKERVAWKSMSLSEIYQEIQGLKVDDVLSLLNEYLDRDTVTALGYSNFVDLRKFTAFFLWLVNVKGYRVSDVGLVRDPETEEPLFLAVYVNCGEAEWRSMSMSVKRYMAEQGFRDLAGKVALICKGVL